MRNFLTTITLFSLIYSQDLSEEIKIRKVRVEGNKTTSEKTIIFTAGLQSGEIVTLADFPRAIKRLWQLGLFKDIQINYDKEDEEGLDLVIKVEENYILGELKFEGNKKIKDRKFEDEINITKGQRIQPNTLIELSKEIKDIYI